MKYKCEIVINLPITDVVELWSNETYFKHWQDGFQSIEIIEGEAGEIGAKSKILLQQGKRKMVLMETIISNKLPVEKKALSLIKIRLLRKLKNPLTIVMH